ncbi:hypothetical protein TNIN_265321 [Trichonephila inaurata madagascariensis]|uniref:Mutator-like transposase domain-containing protein n=1 Tax=Trichonephila inaurata madagascariensis TaxID=2747483 RepID=A0A8X6XHQ1_9ARAC|nr:hypothetical protein TNIN_265321 [Trichonephila inaurata madagascariensis]
MTLKCENCDYSFSFCTYENVNKLHSINLAFVFGMRIIGKGHSAAKTLCSAININVPSKRAFGFLEKKLEFAVSNVAYNTMKEAALEIRSNKTDDQFSQCGECMAVIQFNKGFQGLIDILKHFGVTVGVLILKSFSELDEIRKSDSKRHSLTVAKAPRKKRLAKKKKMIKNELKEGVSYKTGEF